MAHVEMGSQIFTRDARCKSLLLQEVPRTPLKSTQCDPVLGLGQRSCAPGTARAYPRESNVTASGAFKWICRDAYST